jgi:hypothetical protein
MERVKESTSTPLILVTTLFPDRISPSIRIFGAAPAVIVISPGANHRREEERRREYRWGGGERGREPEHS